MLGQDTTIAWPNATLTRSLILTIKLLNKSSLITSSADTSPSTINQNINKTSLNKVRCLFKEAPSFCSAPRPTHLQLNSFKNGSLVVRLTDERKLPPNSFGSRKCFVHLNTIRKYYRQHRIPAAKESRYTSCCVATLFRCRPHSALPFIFTHK